MGTLRIGADLLVPGRGAPVHDGVVVLEGAAITLAGPGSQAPPGRSDDELHRVETLLPGLWDCHVHLLGTRTADPTASVRGSPLPRLSLELVCRLVVAEPTIRLCDGVDDCTTAVREQLRDGARARC